MNFLSSNNFTSELAIGQLESPVVNSILKDFIDKYEPDFITQLIGETLYSELIEGLSQPVPEDKWIKLRDELIYPCACFVWVKYMRWKTTQPTGMGEVLPKTEISERVGHWDKIVVIWNDMVEKCISFICQFNYNEDYPSFSYQCSSEIFKRINYYAL